MTTLDSHPSSKELRIASNSLLPLHSFLFSYYSNIERGTHVEAHFNLFSIIIKMQNKLQEGRFLGEEILIAKNSLAVETTHQGTW